MSGQVNQSHVSAIVSQLESWKNSLQSTYALEEIAVACEVFARILTAEAQRLRSIKASGNGHH